MTNSSTPVQVTGLTDATAIAVGLAHACALRLNGSVVCWGGGLPNVANQGQLGNGMTVNSAVPVTVLGW
jgi:hypothetical protein